MRHQDTVPDKVENLIYAVRKGFRILHMLFRNTGQLRGKGTQRHRRLDKQLQTLYTDTILNDLPAEFDDVIKTAG